MPGKISQVVPQPPADSTETCSFWFLDADFVRTYSGKKLPFFQELRDKHPNALVKVTISYIQVVRGTHVKETLAVSHRWMYPREPDPDGEQLKAIKAFLNSASGEQIKRMWIDSACMPQDQPEGSRTPQDTADFKVMLANVNMLYLGLTVLILLDLSYVSRFWTQFEAWLSMQFATPGGLKPAIGTQNVRHHIVCIQNAAAQSELYTKALVDNWADKTPLQAHDFLSKPDVTVTNASDKEGQLPKIKALDVTVQGAFRAIETQLEQRVAAAAELLELAKALEAAEQSAASKRQQQRAAAEALSHAKADLAQWETENDAKAGDRNPKRVAVQKAELELISEAQIKEMDDAVAAAQVVLKEHNSKMSAQSQLPTLNDAVKQAEREVAAARAAKQMHGQAIVHGVTPMVMEREEGRRIVEEARKAEAEAKAAKERAVAEARAAKERAAAEKREANAARTSQFQDGPCKECCMDSCITTNCVSADGNKVYCCVPTRHDYFLPLCLHTCLCPQQGGSPYPSGHHEWDDGEYCGFPFLNNTCLCCIQKRGKNIQLPNEEPAFYICCWEWA